ncbi:MAG: hypothetical protein COT85_05120 [Chlamydiae bacterium CG10_big_fil_rev_8_21_14_0_10_42_34]|nr:MAG: hypothetical protein COT85_05120 [Chlamydiae bacterium CG10_big_fil_rev_8_21_14_0_10_42_34]
MSFIGPIQRKQDVKPINSVTKTASKAKATAQKVGKIELPVVTQISGLGGRSVSPLKSASDLFKKITRQWNSLAPEEQAEQIIDLQGKVALLEGTSPAIEKIKKQVEHLHFQFVFPVALELSQETISFAKEVARIANQVIKTNSSGPFTSLNQMQQKEVMRYARGEG